jgi:hypothetical protein
VLVWLGMFDVFGERGLMTCNWVSSVWRSVWLSWMGVMWESCSEGVERWKWSLLKGVGKRLAHRISMMIVLSLEEFC